MVNYKFATSIDHVVRHRQRKAAVSKKKNFSNLAFNITAKEFDSLILCPVSRKPNATRRGGSTKLSAIRYVLYGKRPRFQNLISKFSP